jgi:hypothetical protein
VAGSVLDLASVRFFYWRKIMTTGQDPSSLQNLQSIHSLASPSQNGSGANWQQKFRPDAWLLYQQYCENFAQDLLKRSEFYADRRKAQHIIKPDVDRALIDLEDEGHNINLLKKGSEGLAGIFVGISGSGFITELYSGPTSWFIVYVGFLVVAFMLILWSYHQH